MMMMKLKHTLTPALVAGALTLSGTAMADQATANLDISLKGMSEKPPSYQSSY